MFRKFIITAVFMMVCVFTSAQTFANTAKGIGIGEVALLNVSVLDKDSQEQSIKSFVGEKGLVIVFVRSLDWCPYCQLQMVDVERRTDEFQEAGYNVVSISYDKPEDAAQYIQKFNRSVSVLFDPEGKAIDAFKIKNEEIAPDNFAYGMAWPAVYVVNKQGLVRGKFYEDDFKQRPNVDDVLDAIKRNFR